MWIYLYLFCLALLCFLNQNISVSQQFWESLSDSLFKNILSPFFLSLLRFSPLFHPLPVSGGRQLPCQGDTRSGLQNGPHGMELGPPAKSWEGAGAFSNHDMSELTWKGTLQA